MIRLTALEDLVPRNTVLLGGWPMKWRAILLNSVFLPVALTLTPVNSGFECAKRQLILFITIPVSTAIVPALPLCIANLLPSDARSSLAGLTRTQSEPDSSLSRVSSLLMHRAFTRAHS
mmetsp:Transcript_21925/g.47840  ORF Transcript_21925/g.47840 Transcript_21925/m.47840 type:complete len:119 (-) Transcript_21925:101-457(-)